MGRSISWRPLAGVFSDSNNFIWACRYLEGHWRMCLQTAIHLYRQVDTWRPLAVVSSDSNNFKGHWRVCLRDSNTFIWTGWYLEGHWRLCLQTAIVLWARVDILKAIAGCVFRQQQVRYLMRGINGEKLGLKCLNVGKYWQYKVYVE